MIDKLAMGLITIGGQVYKVAPSVARRLAKEFGIKGATKAQSTKVKTPIKLTSANATKLAQSSKKNKVVTLGQDKVPLSSSQKKLKAAVNAAKKEKATKKKTGGTKKPSGLGKMSGSNLETAKKIAADKIRKGPDVVKDPKVFKQTITKPVKNKTNLPVPTGKGKNIVPSSKGRSLIPKDKGKSNIPNTGGKNLDSKRVPPLNFKSLKGKGKGKLLDRQNIVPLTALSIGLSSTGTGGDKPKQIQAKSKPNKQKIKSPATVKKKKDMTKAELNQFNQAKVKPTKSKTFEEKLKAKFIKGRGGRDSFKSDKQIDSSWESELMEMREGADAGFSYQDQQNYDKVMDERGAKGKKAGGQVKRKYGGVVKRRGGMQVGKVTNPSRIKSTIKMANGGGVGNKFIASLYK
jgi:hypothetical protein